MPSKTIKQQLGRKLAFILGTAALAAQHILLRALGRGQKITAVGAEDKGSNRRHCFFFFLSRWVKFAQTDFGKRKVDGTKKGGQIWRQKLAKPS